MGRSVWTLVRELFNTLYTKSPIFASLYYSFALICCEFTEHYLLARGRNTDLLSEKLQTKRCPDIIFSKQTNLIII